MLYRHYRLGFSGVSRVNRVRVRF